MQAQIKNGGTVQATYAYDGQGRRAVKVAPQQRGSNRTYTIYSGSQVVSEFSDASTATYTAGTTPAQAPSDTVALLLYQHYDHMNVRVATDQQGNVAYQHGNFPYGDPWYDTGPPVTTSVPRKLTKYRLEPELTSSFVNQALYREHSARMGRFHTPDVKSGSRYNPQRMNRYSYASNDPINRWDPRGTDSCQCVDDCNDADLQGPGLSNGMTECDDKGGDDDGLPPDPTGPPNPPNPPDPCDPVTGLNCGPDPQPCDPSDPSCGTLLLGSDIPCSVCHGLCEAQYVFISTLCLLGDCLPWFTGPYRGSLCRQCLATANMVRADCHSRCNVLDCGQPPEHN